ncbi:hypothetical protein [Kitasatospora aureofaciens]|uniref:hypothetical protein n=1 Tax=Kitasatospora aureofaciens TaxID=1894 RepID=UPI0036F46E00
MGNTGGREHRADHDARLVAEAGLRLLGHSPLPLDAAVLHARRATVPAPAGQAAAPGPVQDRRGVRRPGRLVST